MQFNYKTRVTKVSPDGTFAGMLQISTHYSACSALNSEVACNPSRSIYIANAPPINFGRTVGHIKDVFNMEEARSDIELTWKEVASYTLRSFYGLRSM